MAPKIARPPTNVPHPETLPNGGDIPQEILPLIKKITVKQAHFALNYWAGAEDVRGNGTRSAIAAGFSKSSAPSLASQLLRHDGVRAVLDALMRASSREAVISRGRFVELALQQANSWLDDDGNPREMPVIASGGVVIGEFVVRDRTGNVVYRKDDSGNDVPATVKAPIVELVRPNSTNVEALKLVGKACGFIVEARAGSGEGDMPANPLPAGNTPVAGYSQEDLPDTQLDTFLKALPAPRDTGARTAMPTAATPAQA